MALFKIDEPVELTLARNPAIVQLRAVTSSLGPAYSAQGVAVLMEADFPSRFASGEELTVTYTEPDGTTETVTFTGANTPDEIDKIPTGTWSGDNASYWTEIATIVGKHPRIAPFFEVEIWSIAGDPFLRLLARDAVGEWEVTITNDLALTVTQVDPVADSTPANYRVLLEVFFEKTYLAGNYERVAQLEGWPSPPNGWLYFDISNILEAQCRATRVEPLVPEFGTDVPTKADNLRRYYIRYTEEYGTPVAAQEWQYSDVKYAMDGGVSQALHAESGYYGYPGTIDDTTSLLTWMPDGRTLGESQPEYLAWHNYTGATQQVVLQRIQYDVADGAAIGTTLYLYGGDTVDVLPYETLLIPVGPDMMTLDDEAYKYTVRVVDATSDWEGGSPEFFSPLRRYYVDRQYTESQRYVQYLNGFGVPECWRCTGEWSKKLAVSRSAAEKVLAPGYNVLASDNFQYARDFELQLTYRTGYLRKGEAEVLQEMLIAGEVYDVGEDGYIPLRITSNSFAVTSTRENLHSYTIEVRPRLSMRNFSKKVLTGPASDAWQEVNNDSWFDAVTVAWNLP